MLSLIEVKCPHCGAQGQIMLPPLGAIIIGPCPECEGMVVVFCGRVLPLDKEIMTEGNIAEKRDHLMEALNRFLRERIERLFAQAATTAEKINDDRDELEHRLLDEADEMGLEHAEAERPQQGPRKLIVPISQEEFDSFINTDLSLLDNKEYFKAVFE